MPKQPPLPQARSAHARQEAAGEFARAIDAAQDHMRADPFYLSQASASLGLAFYMLRDYAEALPQLEETVSRAPNWLHGHIFLAATYAQMGQSERAGREAVEVMRMQPGYTIDGTARRLMVFKNPSDADHFFDGLAKAGLPVK